MQKIVRKQKIVQNILNARLMKNVPNLRIAKNILHVRLSRTRNSLENSGFKKARNSFLMFLN
jgi:hypothetical protein